MISLRSLPLLSLLAVAPLLGAGCGEGASESADAEANQAILDELSSFPNADVAETSVNPYEREGESGAAGHTTNVRYTVPEGTSASAMIGFYRSQLEPAWDCGGNRIILSCSRGNARLGVNLDNLGAERPSFELVINHDDRTG